MNLCYAVLMGNLCWLSKMSKYVLENRILKTFFFKTKVYIQSLGVVVIEQITSVC